MTNMSPPINRWTGLTTRGDGSNPIGAAKALTSCSSAVSVKSNVAPRNPKYPALTAHWYFIRVFPIALTYVRSNVTIKSEIDQPTFSASGEPRKI